MRSLILAFAVLFAMVSCNKAKDPGSNVAKIVIKGNISVSNLKSTGLKSVNSSFRCQKSSCI